MKIEYKDTPYIKLKELYKGQVFTSDKLRYYIKSENHSDKKECLCVDLQSGESYNFSHEIQVKPVETKLIIL